MNLNPYANQTFFETIRLFFIRLIQGITGQLSFQDLSSDEIQVIVLTGVAASSALVGSFLVLRKITMLANSISHTILVGLVIAFLWTSHTGIESAAGVDIHSMLIASLVMGLITAFLTEILTKVAKLQEDASTGLVFTSLFAFGVILLTTLTRNAHIGTEIVMGNVDILQLSDCQLVYAILGLNLLLFLLFFKEYKITTFDPGLSRTFGISPVIFNYLLLTQVSTTAIGAFRAVGVIMVLALMTGPVLTARLLTHRLNHLLSLSVFFGIISCVIGVALSRHIFTVYGIPLSTGGIIVCVIALVYLVVICLKKSKLGRVVNRPLA